MDGTPQSGRVWIYALADPETAEHHYVGSTQKPQYRMTQHLADAQQLTWMDTPKLAWMRSLLARGVSPVLMLLESASVEDRLRIEDAWLTECQSQGCPLTNARRPTRPRGLVISPGENPA